MTKNDFFLGIGFIGTILSVGFHTIGYELKSFSELQLFLKDNPILFICFIISLFLTLICVKRKLKGK